MKYLIAIIIFCFLFSYSSYSQNNIEQKIKGNWIRTHSEMKDSSKVVRYTANYHDFIVYMFEDKGKGYATINPLQGRTSFDYILKGKLLGINGQPYKIESITDSTLVLCEAYTNLTDDKLHRNYYKRVENFAKDSLLNKNDNIYESSKNLFPIYKRSNLISEIEEEIGENTFINELEINAIITKDGKIENINVVDKKGLSDKKINLIIKILTNTNKNWIPAKINTIPIDINITFIFNSYEIMSITKIRMKNLYTNDNLLKELDYKEKEQADTYFQQAIEAYQKGKLENAIKYFSKCIEIDSTYLDAYYNRATLNLELGNKEEACKDWLYLIKLEQRTAKTYFNENCN